MTEFLGKFVGLIVKCYMLTSNLEMVIRDALLDIMGVIGGVSNKQTFKIMYGGHLDLYLQSRDLIKTVQHTILSLIIAPGTLKITFMRHSLY